MYEAINGHKIVRSGVIVSQNKDSIEIRPFDDDTAFAVKIEYIFENKDVGITFHKNSDQDKTLSVVCSRPHLFNGDKFSNADPMIFAFSDDRRFRYLLNIFTDVVGVKEQYTILTAFTIYAETVEPE